MSDGRPNHRINERDGFYHKKGIGQIWHEFSGKNGITMVFAPFGVNCAEMLLVNDGEIIERGTHQSLLADRGFYCNMYTSQFKGTAVAD